MSDDKNALLSEHRNPVLELAGLRTSFETNQGVLKAVDDVSLEVREGEVLGLVGESGCGKSVTALSIMRLLPSPPGKVVGGSIRLAGKDLLKMSNREMQHIRGNEISMIYQDPLTALNPVLSVGYQLIEGIRQHRRGPKREARVLALNMLKQVGIPDPNTVLRAYPHQLSGGMRQRVMISMALACEPQLLIADEPTTALDVTIQAQVLSLLKQLQRDTGTAIIMITHDLGVVAEMADRISVMYGGRIVETATTLKLFSQPSHPYTVGLLESIPRLYGPHRKFKSIPGVVPTLAGMPTGCRFAPRCNYATEQCEVEPDLEPVEHNHLVRCWYATEVGQGRNKK